MTKGESECLWMYLKIETFKIYSQNILSVIRKQIINCVQQNTCICFVEKLDPPRNINWSFTEGNRDLQVQWDRAMSRSVTKIKCDVYQINIDEVVMVISAEL